MPKAIPDPMSRDIDTIPPAANPTKGPWRAIENSAANPLHTYWEIQGGNGRFNDDGYGFCLTGFISPPDAAILGAAWELYQCCKWLKPYAEVQVRNHPDAQDTPNWQLLLDVIAKTEAFPTTPADALNDICF
jgi:hypothetical protein